jgi:hypothetical protein
VTVLTGLTLGDAPERWAALGFAPAGDALHLGGVRVQLGASGDGIVAWTLAHGPGGNIDGLPTRIAPPTGEPAKHPNGATGLDHVVVVTPDFERTSAALDAAGLSLRRIRHVPEGDFRQGFRRLGPCILELVEAREAPPGPARFWGLVIVVEDLEALAQRLGDHLGHIKPAVQPGRRIATLRREAGLGAAVAFMDPE